MRLGLVHPMQRIAPWLVDTSRVNDGGTFVAAIPLNPQKTGDEVTITVSVADDRRYANDIVAAYTPFDADISKVSPVRVARLRYETGAEVDEPTAVVKMYLTNMRSDYKFVVFESPQFYCNPDPLSNGCDDWSFFDGAEAAITAVATSPDPVRFFDSNEPRAARVLPAYPQQFKIVWTSNGEEEDNGCDLSGGRGFVLASKTASPAYHADDLCGSPAKDVGFLPPGAVHEVAFACAAPEVVTYRCGSYGDYLFDEKTFRCPAAAFRDLQDEDDNAESNTTTITPPTKIAIFGDLGRGERDGDDSITFHEYGAPARKTAELLASYDDLDFVFHNGDLSYAVGYLSVHDDYLDMIEQFASKFPYGVGLGNHEIDYPSYPADRRPSKYTGFDSGGECGVPAMRLFPVADTEIYNKSWWSVDVGLMHVAVLNDEVDYSRGSDQWRWLEKDLAEVDREATPWVIVSGHRPMYVDSSYSNSADGGAGDVDVMENLILHVEPLLLEFQVDVFWAGHNHAAQRHCTCRDGQCVDRPDENSTYSNPRAPLQLVVGTGGADFTRNANNSDFAVNVFYKFGVGILTAHNATHLTYDFVDNGANGPLGGDSVQGMVLDSATIVRDLPAQGSHRSSKKKHTGIDHQDAIIIAALVVAVMVIALIGLAASRKRNTGEYVVARIEDDDEVESDRGSEQYTPSEDGQEIIATTNNPSANNSNYVPPTSTVV
eukprot:CAMPEP_0118891548 /NCGR_PEP_ID=MMETSP1166-20130328/1520_1 /TAXON_ID=1104430 /ORGANISM="Chrysoreinhardia sp, Strain CCMP3193" /LENGTH=714 /DNA_ID=CAMNT_0006830213 /DNA_START=177 /DNA_END=2321 /DNA_ORIENTATION=-